MARDLVDLGFHAGNRDYPTFDSVPIAPHSLFVRRNGRDTNDGSSPDQSLATIRRAVEIAHATTTIVVGRTTTIIVMPTG